VGQVYTTLSISRTQFHRKLTALTDQSAGDFIRRLRPPRGKELLQKDAGIALEVANQVGFNSIACFTKCLREQFGVVPSEVRLGRA
jgi:AraC-like DNA-binding protein